MCDIDNESITLQHLTDDYLWRSRPFALRLERYWMYGGKVLFSLALLLLLLLRFLAFVYCCRVIRLYFA